MSHTGDKPKDGLNFQLDIHNFGPILTGKISMKPLTILVGPNNSGKSYAAMLIFSFFENLQPGPLFHRGRYFSSRRQLSDLAKRYPGLYEEAKKFLNQKEITNFPDFTKPLLDFLLEDMYREFGNELVKSFASPVKDLVSIGRRNFWLKVKYQSQEVEFEYRRDKVVITKFVNSIAPTMSGMKFKATRSGLRVSFGSGGYRVMETRIPITTSPEYFLRFLLDAYYEWMYREMNRRVFYLPAARSGILQGHRALAASIVKRAGYAGIERLDIPLLSGMVSGFISSVIAIEDMRGPLYDLGSQLEKEITRGEIILRSQADNVVPEIRYKIQDNEIPLHRASSTVSEIAPLILYLKYYLRPRSILIIEEPEAHLHPENQRLMAKYLVRLIRRGVHVVITTHSPLLIEQISIFMKLSKIEREKRNKEYQYGVDDYLKYEEVSAYLFKPDKNSVLNKIDPIPVTTEGISQDEFMRINENLYEETYKVEKNMSPRLDVD